MNDTTLPIPKSGTNNDNNTNEQNSHTRRHRTPHVIQPGFALHDWLTFLSHSKTLSRLPLRNDIPASEIATHCHAHDAWIILYDKVYNITPYLPYHPGGLEVLKPVLGKDGTKLFEKYHRWVNLEGLIGKLLLGYLNDVVKKVRQHDGDEKNTDSCYSGLDVRKGGIPMKTSISAIPYSSLEKSDSQNRDSAPSATPSLIYNRNDVDDDDEN